MSREFIQELRGNMRCEAIDTYGHIDKKEPRESYLALILQLGIYAMKSKLAWHKPLKHHKENILSYTSEFNAHSMISL